MNDNPTIIDAIENVSKICVISTIGEHEVLVEITADHAFEAIDNVPNSEKAVLNPDNDNFYIDSLNRSTQIAWFDGANDTLIIGQ